MIPKGLVAFSSNQIEQKARDLFRRRPDIEFAPPINVESLLEQTVNVDLQIKDDLISKHRVEGCVCKQFMSRLLTVYVDSALLRRPWSVYNAVLAEEFAHIHLHGSLFLYVNSIEDFVDLQCDPEWSRFERDAKVLSAAIRMPVALVMAHAERVYPHVVDVHGFGDALRIEQLVRNELASTFRVSMEEMRRRMNDPYCRLRNRLINSVQAGEMTLAPDTWSVSVEPPIVQQWLPHE